MTELLPYGHPLLGTLTLLLAFFVFRDGFAQRKQRLSRIPATPASRARHVKFGPWSSALMVVSALGGIGSTLFLRNWKFLASFHGKMGVTTVLMFLVMWWLGRRLNAGEKQLAGNHELMADVLRQLNTGCVVISRDLAILHINRTARGYFTRPGRRGSDFEFSDLPPALGSKVYQVLKTGAGMAPFKFQPPDAPNTLFQVTVLPVQTQNVALPTSVLLMVEDHSQNEQLQRLEIEAANLRLVKQMADRLAHEIGNALVPLSTHQQLLAKKYDDPEFRASLDTSLADGVRRVTRLINQMRFLSRDAVVTQESFPLAPLIEEAYQEAQKYQPVKSAQLKYNIGKQAFVLAGDRASLKHAMAEIMLNALQANPNNARIAVEMRSEPGPGTGGWVHIEFRDNGAGFSPEAAKRVPEAFYTTRNVGLGLGLVVTRRVVETHRGKLEVVPPQSGQSGVVRLSLPLAALPPAE